MSVFTEGMNLSIQPAMDQMAETFWLHGSIPIKGIFDPLENTKSRMAGGVQDQTKTTLFVKRSDATNNGIKKGDKITLQHGNGELVKSRVQVVTDDGTDLLILSCEPILTGVVPG